MWSFYLVDGLARSQKLVGAALLRIPVYDLARPTGPGRFTPVEVLAHLADWEPIFAARMVAAVESPGTLVEVYDEGERADALGYADADPVECLGAWAQARAETVAFLRKLDPEGWEACIVHPERGQLSVLAQAATLLGHDIYHLEQLETAAGRV